MSHAFATRSMLDERPLAATPRTLPFERFKSWMLETALPFWSGAGLSLDGGVVECLMLDGRPARPGFKRVRVHARQIYVFSHAHVIGVRGMLQAARAGVDFLRAHGRTVDGGWVVKMGEAGGVVDDEIDLYDQAFVILALTWWYRASGDGRALDLARDTLAMVERVFARADGRGYLCRRPDRNEALQNPHMHLLEAVLALHETLPGFDTATTIARLLRLFHKQLFDTGSGTLCECFDKDWHPLAHDGDVAVEPGHHYEWVWLLHRAEHLGFGAAEPVATRLFDFAERHGLVARTALIHDRVAPDGRVLGRAHRSWPQTERIKALVAHGTARGRFDVPAIDAALDALWTYYIAPAAVGGWIDHVDGDGSPCVAAIPASTLYHLFLAYAELERNAGQVFGEHSGGGSA